MNVNEAKGTLKRMQKYDLGVVDGKVDTALVGPYMRNLGVPSKFCSEPLPSIDNVRTPQAKRWVEHLDADHPGIYLYGGRPLGKTYTAAAITRWCLEVGRTVAWVNWAEYLRLHTAKLDKTRLVDEDDVREEVRHMEYLRRAYNVVVIDGLDLHSNAAFVYGELTGLIHQRTDEGLYTVITGRKLVHDPTAAPLEVQVFLDMSSMFETVSSDGRK